MQLRSGLSVLALLLIAVTAAGQTSPKAPSLFERVARLLGLDKRAVARATKPRSSKCSTAATRHGTDLLLRDCKAGAERILWHCEDCWSPAMAGSAGIAVLKPDGLWLVSDTGQAKQAVQGGHFRAILGLSTTPGSLLIVREVPDGGSLVLSLVDLGSGQITDVAEQPPPSDAPKLINIQSAAISGSKVLRTTVMNESRCAREILVEPDEGQALASVCAYKPLEGAWDRFEPGWAGTNVVYMGRREENR